MFVFVHIPPIWSVLLTYSLKIYGLLFWPTVYMGLWLAAAEERRNWPEGREDCDCWHEQENTDSVEHDADVDAGYIRLQTTTNNATVDSTLRPRRYPGYIFLNRRRFFKWQAIQQPARSYWSCLPLDFSMCSGPKKSRDRRKLHW